ncbi:MAG: DMT family transporter [bacterium]|nr:DMT family transporter [bacterium]
MWLLIAVLAYFIFAVVFLVDKWLLAGPIPNHRIYSFYVGILGVAVVLLIPFVNFRILEPSYLFLAFASGASFVLGILWFFKGLKLYEPSRIVPAVGGISPIFTFLLVYIFSGGKELFNLSETTSFLLIIFGSVLITHEIGKKISWKSLRISAVSAFFFALSFVFAKYIYAAHPFLLGLIWIRLGGVLMALILLFDSQLRKNLFKERIVPQRKIAAIFFLSQAGGAAAGILQNWAIALAPLVYVAFVSALQGAQYGFLLILAIFLSLKFPAILKEEISGRTLFQKIAAILLISVGLAILAA